MRVTRMMPKGPELVHYDEYVKYVADGEQHGTLSYEEWLVRIFTPSLKS